MAIFLDYIDIDSTCGKLLCPNHHYLKDFQQATTSISNQVPALASGHEHIGLRGEYHNRHKHMQNTRQSTVCHNDICTSVFNNGVHSAAAPTFAN